jgi:invasin-like protein
MRKVWMGLAAVLLLAGFAQADLTVVWVDDDGGANLYNTVATYWSVTSPGKWEALVDEDTGAIFSFKDLTDAGWLTNGHANYMGQSTITGGTVAYDLATPMLWFNGRETDVLRSSTLADVADRLTFTPGTSTFTITYTEDGTDPLRYEATDPKYYLWGEPINGTPYLGCASGDVYSTVTVTLNEADGNGTIFDWSWVCEINDDLDGRIFQVSGYVSHEVMMETSYTSYNPNEVAQTITKEETKADGAWNPAAPVSYSTRTIDDGGLNSLYGLTVGRTFTLDHVVGHTGDYTAGGVFWTDTWATSRSVRCSMPGNPSSTPVVPNGTTKTWSGTLRINIGDGLLANTSTTMSTVTAAPSGVPADGATTATVTINLRDGNGLVISGEDAAITVLMSGGPTNTIESPVRDLGNGKYEATIASDAAGPQTVSVEVDNGTSTLTLADTPTVDFFSTGVDAGNSFVDALLSKVPSDGSLPGAFEITLRNSGDNPVLGLVNADFTIHEDGGSDLGLTVTEVGNGVYRATGYTNSTAATYTISVVADSVAITDTASVEVTDDSFPALFFTAHPTIANIGVVTCRETDDSQSYWQLTIDENAYDTGGGGRCMSFFDLRGSGYSDPAYDYAYRYAPWYEQSPFMFTAASSVTDQVYTAGAKIDGMIAYNYTIQGTPYGGAEAVVDSAVTIHAADATGTKFESNNTFSNPTATTDNNVRIMTRNRLHTQQDDPADGLWDTSESDPSGYGSPPNLVTVVGNHTVSVANAGDAIAAGMFPGLSFTLTAEDVYDHPYVTNNQLYDNYGADYHELEITFAVSDQPTNSGIAGGASFSNRSELMIGLAGPIPTPGDPDADMTSVGAAPDTVTANGINTTTVTIVLRDAAGMPVGGVSPANLVVNCDGSNNFISSTSEVVNGTYEATIKSTTAEVKNVSVVWTGTVTMTTQPVVTFIAVGNPDSALSSVVGADDNYIEADGATTYKVTITLLNANGDAIPGVEGDLDINVTGGAVPGAVTHLGAGVYEVDLTSTIGAEMTVTVTYDPGGANITLDDTVEVVFVISCGELVYSGDDISAGDGTMTIRSQHNVTATGAWELEVTRAGDVIRTLLFDDLTDSGDFNYAGDIWGGANGLFVADAGGPFVEVTKTADEYVFTRTTADAEWERKTVYTLKPSNTFGMFLYATRTVENVGVADQLLEYGMMSAYLGLGVGPCNAGIPYGLDGLPGVGGFDDDDDTVVDNPEEIGYGDDYGATGAECYLTTPYDGSELRYHKDSGDADAIWQFEDNVDRGDHDAGGGHGTDGIYDATDVMWAEFTVMDNATTLGLGMTAGRTWSLSSDIVAYYPGTAIGNIYLNTNGTVYDALVVAITPREWNGNVRADFYDDPLGDYRNATVGQVWSKEFVYFCDIPCPTAPLTETIEVTAVADFNWVYPNTPVTTHTPPWTTYPTPDPAAMPNHYATITIDMTTGGADTYTIVIDQDGGVLTDFSVRDATQLVGWDGAAATTVDVAGGLDTVSTPGSYTLNVNVTGDSMGGVDSKPVTMKLRVFADVDDSGSVDTTDKLEINRELNGIAVTPGITPRMLDLTGNSAIDTNDKLQVNRNLNGLLVP